jgi:alpha-N-arabinofuranosidase
MCKDHASEKVATFRFFEYEGNDPFYRSEPLQPDEYYNPVLPGFYPDPSVCRKGEDYYLVTSSFAWFPAIPVFHSKNLVHWDQIGHVFNKPGQISLDSLAISEGVFAPDISYNPHNDTFYLVNTLVGKGGNFVTKAKDPAGPWSNPVWLPEIDGIDPSLFFDGDGKTYLVHNGPSEGKPLYPGHRTIRIREFDPVTCSVSAREAILVDGGVDIAKKPVWIEGPHIYKVSDTYYLTAAEGGTGENHSEVIFTAENVWGPYKPAPTNPILTQRDLPEERLLKVTCTGHADLTDTPEGNWAVVFLGCRPYKENFYNLGRETFLLPVTWENRIPIILPSGQHVPMKNRLEGSRKDLSHSASFPSGNFRITDEFDSTDAAIYWNFIRIPEENWHHFRNGNLTVQCRPVQLGSRLNPSFIGRRQQHNHFSVTTAVNLAAGDSTQKAGLALFTNETHFYFAGIKHVNGRMVVFLEKSGKEENTPTIHLARIETGYAKEKDAFLKITGEMPYYHFYFSGDNENWIPLSENVDATFLSTATAGGFTGTYIGMYATDESCQEY